MTKANKWICSVCGYVHEGSAPPDYCPICGATSDLFNPHEEPQKTVGPEKVTQWRCLNCEYLHQGEGPPGYCPVCGATADRFESFSQTQAYAAPQEEKRNIVVVGGGIAGISAAEAIRSTSPGSDITLISKEADLPYYRLNLTRYLAGELGEEQLPLYPQDWYKQQDIQLLSGVETVSINPDQKKISLKDGQSLPYSQLILTVGSHPFVPPWPGTNKENVIVLRSKGDADFIMTQTKNPLNCVVIGGGLLGLEAAGALAKRKVDVTLLEGYGWLLPRQLNKKAAALLEQQIASLGIQLKTKTRTREIVGDERVKGVLLEDDTLIPADLVIITTGVRSNSYMARLAGLEVNKGIVVSNHLQTSNEHIFAAGDVAEHQGISYGTWGSSQFQGKIAGINAAGGNAEFAGIPRSNMLKVLGVDLFSLGQITAEDASYRTFDGTIGDNYFYFVFRDSHMLGFIFLGDTSLSGQAKHIVEGKVDCSSLLKGPVDIDKILTFISTHTN